MGTDGSAGRRGAAVPAYLPNRRPACEPPNAMEPDAVNEIERRRTNLRAGIKALEAKPKTAKKRGTRAAKKVEPPAVEAAADADVEPEPKRPAGRVINKRYELALVDSLKQHPKNARRGNLEAIDESVGENGFYGAVVAQVSTRRILAGNHRWLSAKHAGLAKVPVIWVDVDDRRAEKILLADNRSNDLASYDDSALIAVLQELAEDGGLAGTGYSDFDLEGLVKKLAGIPPTEFVAFDASLETTHICPRCKFEF